MCCCVLYIFFTMVEKITGLLVVYKQCLVTSSAFRWTSCSITPFTTMHMHI